MKKNTRFPVFLVIFLITQYCFAQVDVVYSDLVWSDEFDKNGSVDANNWFHQTQLPVGGSWFNNEVQHYTDRIENSSVNSGFLKIVAIKENYTNQGVTKAYTSARLNSKFSFKYGRVDVRAKIPVDQGTWPAIWMLGKNTNEDGG
jgi:beta-glucanase (GH16 family)